MKHSKILRILLVATLLSLPVLVVPGTPALAAPLIVLSPTSGTAGAMVTMTGTNFESYRGDRISIYFDNIEITTSPLIVPQAGSFTFNFNIPDAEPGKHSVRVRSALGSTLALSTFIIPETEISLDTGEGTVGTTVTIKGKGFYADKTITFYYYNLTSEKLGTEVATSAGEFSYSFTIPVSTAGRHRIIAENAEGNTAEAEFDVLPSVILNTTSGATGDILAVSGSGFGYKDEVIIYFRDTVVAYARTNEYGSFEVSFNVPAMKPSTYDVKIRDTADNSDKAEFTIVAGARLNKTEGSVGTELTVIGTGFMVSGTVVIKYDDLEIATTPADSKYGAFSVYFNVPIGISGQHLVTVSDGTNTKQLAFNVESEAPPIPSSVLPANASETKAEAYLDWEDVDDPSLPVTYHLQVASDQYFTSLVLEKTGLANSEYILTKEEKLPAVKKEAPYCWRVKAVDSASNKSEWSTPWSFYVGFAFALPGWAIFTLIGLGALLIGFLAFWLGRRTAYFQHDDYL